jgi:hypothetical protein
LAVGGVVRGAAESGGGKKNNDEEGNVAGHGRGWVDGWW